MKNLDKLYHEALEEVKNAGIEAGKIVCVRPNDRAKNVWGYCKRRNGAFIIEISTRLLQDDISDIKTKQTIIHEILHSAKDGMGHKGAWQEMANIINRKYPQYNVKRTNSWDEMGVIDKPENHRYNVICQSCGHIYNYDRFVNVVQNPSYYRCGACRGKLSVRCNIEGMEMYSAANRV